MVLILEEENKRKSREYLDIAIQFWSKANEGFIGTAKGVNTPRLTSKLKICFL